MTGNTAFDKQNFKKEERLKSTKAIEQLFEKGTSVSEYPFKFIWLPGLPAQTALVQTCIAVPKRKIRLATGRNLMKRRIRESFRRNKGLLYQHLSSQQQRISLLILYNGQADMAYAQINEALPKAIAKLIKQHAQHQANI